jgi:hypothetical protein
MNGPNKTLRQLEMLAEAYVDARFGAGAFKDENNSFEVLMQAVKSPTGASIQEIAAPAKDAASIETPKAKLTVLQEFQAITDPLKRGQFYQANEAAIMEQLTQLRIQQNKK